MRSRHDLYLEVQSNPLLKVIFETLLYLVVNKDKLEPPEEVSWKISEDDHHRFFSKKHFRDALSIQMVQAPESVDETEVIHKIFSLGAAVAHMEDQLIEITDLGWELAASYMIGREFDPKYKELRAQRSKEKVRLEAEAGKKRWSSLKSNAEQSVEDYMQGGDLGAAIRSLVALKRGYAESRQPARDTGRWAGEYDILYLLGNAFRDAASQEPQFDYSMQDMYSERRNLPEMDEKYHPVAVKKLLPLWYGLTYYVPEIDFNEFFDLTEYQYGAGSILEQSFVHYVKSGSKASYSVALMAVENFVNNYLSSSTGAKYSMNMLGAHMNRLAYHLNTIKYNRDKYCEFISEIVKRYPILVDEDSGIRDTVGLSELYDEVCENRDVSGDNLGEGMRKSFRRNPDIDVQRLRREFLSGDRIAGYRLLQAVSRTGDYSPLLVDGDWLVIEEVLPEVGKYLRWDQERYNDFMETYLYTGEISGSPHLINITFNTDELLDNFGYSTQEALLDRVEEGVWYDDDSILYSSLDISTSDDILGGFVDSNGRQIDDETMFDLQQAYRDAIVSGTQARMLEELRSALVRALETFGGDNFLAQDIEEDGDISVKGIQKIEANWDTTTISTYPDLGLMINQVIQGVGWFEPDIDELSSAPKGYIKYLFHNLSDYWEVYGDIQPQPNYHNTDDFDEAYFKQRVEEANTKGYDI